MTTTIIAANPRRFQCRHIFTDGHRCGSPCLRHEDFCYYHHTARGRRAIHARTETIDLSQGEHRAAPFTLPIPEDRSAIQHAIGEILNKLAANQLDPRRAGLLLYGLQIASTNLPQAKPATEVHTIEEVLIDATHGALAPPAEILPAEASPSSGLIALLLDRLANPQPTHQPEDPAPSI